MVLPRLPYAPPVWASALVAPRHGRIPFAALPTPIMPWACPLLSDLNVEWWIKRDDMSGSEMCGNKARKLEFLMAEALANEHDCVVTIGGLQSNHCRATAAAARMVGLEPHLVLLVRDKDKNEDPGLQGNLLAARLLGAKLHLCPASEYMRYGGDLAAMDKLNAACAAQLTASGRRPYVVPVGGTTPVGTWGYINAVDELCKQTERQQLPDFDHIVVAAGSGGTAAGLALGLRLSPLRAALHAVNVQHSPESYYELIDAEAQQMGATADLGTARSWLQIHNGGGLGYAVSSKAQLEMIATVGAGSGVLLDHVYTGKALHYFCEHAKAQPEAFRGKRVLFVHTGGLPGLGAKTSELLDHVAPAEPFCPP
jgi:D-cysteine desulfhydrase